MAVTIYMAMSIDGQIARNSDETPWSDASWDSFNTHVNNSDLLVIGRKTYDIMFEGGSIEDIKIPICVLTTKDAGNIKVNICSSVEDVIDYAQKNDWEKIIVAGGGKTNASFLNSGLIDRIIIDIEPIVLGSGIPLFDLNQDDKNIDQLDKFKLEEFKQLEGSNTIQLFYSLI